MKQILFFSLFISLYCNIAFSAQTQYATTHAISAINTATIQHTITQNIFSPFTYPEQQQTPPQINIQDLYGTMPIYGTMPLYGEYNDDGTIGRNGGDTNNALSNIWFNWQYTADDISPDNFNRFDSRYNIATLGISSHKKNITHGYYNWNFYGGYINSSNKNSELNNNNYGGFIGIHNKLNTQNIILNSTINTGSIKHTTDYLSTQDKHTNIWFAATANISYNIKLDDTFNIFPNVSIGYTWIKNQTKNDTYNKELQNQTFGFFEISPTLHAVKQIANNWFGTLSVKHIIQSNTNDSITINNTELTLPTIGNYTEYGISLEKQTTNLNFKFNIGRHDGTISGWTGGLNLKYTF